MQGNSSYFKRKTMHTETYTPQTNHTTSQLDSLQPHNTHSRMRKNSLNIVDELKQLQKRTNNEGKKPKSSSTVSANQQSNSFKEVLRKKQMKHNLDHHYKGLQKYHDALPQYHQEELEYSTFRIIQQNQKQKVEQLKQKYEIVIKAPATRQSMPVLHSKQQEQKGKK